MWAVKLSWLKALYLADKINFNEVMVLPSVRHHGYSGVLQTRVCGILDSWISHMFVMLHLIRISL